MVLVVLREKLVKIERGGGDCIVEDGEWLEAERDFESLNPMATLLSRGQCTFA